MFYGHDRQAYEDLKVNVGKILVLTVITLISFCGCVNKSIIDLDTCTREKLLDCVSSHRIETSSEAIGLVMACQRDMCVGIDSICQK